jgi:hypothetical protein
MKNLNTCDRHKIISGAIFDFVGFLTSLKDNIYVGSTQNVKPILKAIEDWAKEKGLNIDETNPNWDKIL